MGSTLPYNMRKDVEKYIGPINRTCCILVYGAGRL